MAANVRILFLVACGVLVAFCFGASSLSFASTRSAPASQCFLIAGFVTPYGPVRSALAACATLRPAFSTNREAEGVQVGLTILFAAFIMFIRLSIHPKVLVRSIPT